MLASKKRIAIKGNAAIGLISIQVVKSVHGRPFRRPSDKRLWPTSRECLIGSEIRDAFLKNVLISVSNIDQSVEVANAHARYITALHGICR